MANNHQKQPSRIILPTKFHPAYPKMQKLRTTITSLGRISKFKGKNQKITNEIWDVLYDELYYSSVNDLFCLQKDILHIFLKRHSLNTTALIFHIYKPNSTRIATFIVDNNEISNIISSLNNKLEKYYDLKITVVPKKERVEYAITW